MTASALLWTLFGVGICALLALDLGVLNRRPHAPSPREAAGWSAVWVAAAVAFGFGLWWWRGAEAGVRFLTGYLIELSLSVDNVFLFVLIFGAFAVPQALRHRALFWGVLGAIVMRAGMIVGGAALIARLHWIIYVFGGLLLLTGAKMLFSRKTPGGVSEGRLARLIRRFVPVTEQYHGHRFFTIIDGKRHATPLFLVLVLIEGADLMFAIDSIPAIFAIFPDPRQADTFIVFTSNVFAILGLRSLYFLLADIVDKFRFLKTGLAAILIFVGFKMLGVVTVPAVVSLGVIAAILAAAVAASFLLPPSVRHASAGRTDALP